MITDKTKILLALAKARTPEELRAIRRLHEERLKRLEKGMRQGVIYTEKETRESEVTKRRERRVMDTKHS